MFATRVLAVGAVAAACGALAVAPASAAPQTDSQISEITPCAAGTAAEHPVLLVHGTGRTVEQSLGPTRQALVDDGRCVYGVDYDSWGPVSDSVDLVTTVADRILAVNGATSLDLVGKSQGGLIVRAVSLRFTDRPANPIDQVVAISGPQLGSGTSGIGALVQAAPNLAAAVLPRAAVDMTPGSPFLTALNSGPLTAAGVRYTMIGSSYDELVSPTVAFIDGPNVTNILIQDGCPIDHAGHAAEATDPRTIDLTMHTLDPDRHPDIRCAANNNAM
ncbi:esterase/lipase family protein [Nocardia sp. NPDC101769]|uniref:esterase/lipase family protein n=1 Tax=Nocardia sp. NPDC101769 TaxID=3364333 RepID=UPI00380CFA73